MLDSASCDRILGLVPVSLGPLSSTEYSGLRLALISSEDNLACFCPYQRLRVTASSPCRQNQLDWLVWIGGGKATRLPTAPKFGLVAPCRTVNRRQNKTGRSLTFSSSRDPDPHHHQQQQVDALLLVLTPTPSEDSWTQAPVQ